MITTIVQSDIIWAQPEENRRHLGAWMDGMAKADLYVLPEMFSTGFSTDAALVAENDKATLAWMLQKAQELDAAIAGSVATEEGGRFFNRLYFVKPSGEVTAYDKRHLFTYGKEHLHFTAGQERVVVEWRGVRILLAVCYDLRFPVWTRNRKDYDMILYVASWPTSRVKVWNTLLKARAIENQCYVAGVNRVGEDPRCQYCGASAIISPYGEEMASCEWDKECAATADIDMERLRAFRQKFPVLDDADELSDFARQRTDGNGEEKTEALF